MPDFSQQQRRREHEHSNMKSRRTAAPEEVDSALRSAMGAGGAVLSANLVWDLVSNVIPKSEWAILVSSRFRA